MEAELIKAEFKKRRKRQIAVMIVALPLILALSSATLYNDGKLLGAYEDVVMYSMVGVFLSFLVFTLFNWRCPQCDTTYGNKLNVNYCSNCGVQLK